MNNEYKFIEVISGKDIRKPSILDLYLALIPIYGKIEAWNELDRIVKEQLNESKIHLSIRNS